jgi:small GTP-binding protein
MAEVRKLKVVLVGAAHCGKTSLINRYVMNTFTPATMPTTGHAFFERRLRSFGVEADLNIWDTAGQETFHALAPMLYRDAQGALVVFDLTDSRATDSVRQWVSEVRQARGELCSFVIVGNKADLKDQRASNAGEARKYAEHGTIEYFETSAKTGVNVDTAFLALTKKMLAKPEVRHPQQKLRKKETSVRFDDMPESQGSGCC